MFFNKPNEINELTDSKLAPVKSVKVISMAYKDCLVDDDMDYSEQGFLAYNAALIEKCKSDQKQFDKIIFLNGSHRQSHYIDQSNAKQDTHMGSCFPPMLLFCQKAQIHFDTFLMADLYGNKNSGESYTHIVSDAKCSHEHWVFDLSKITLLYAQMHKIASENPHVKIIFEFYDSESDWVLKDVIAFYKKNPELIPPNVTLKIIYYRGNTCGSLRETLEGKKENIIDNNYRETVKTIAKQTPLGIQSPLDEKGNVNPHIPIFPQRNHHDEFFKKLVNERCYKPSFKI